jgi:hypothetical protein
MSFTEILIIWLVLTFGAAVGALVARIAGRGLPGVSYHPSHSPRIDFLALLFGLFDSGVQMIWRA